MVGLLYQYWVYRILVSHSIANHLLAEIVENPAIIIFLLQKRTTIIRESSK